MNRLAAFLCLCLVATQVAANLEEEFVRAHNQRRKYWHELVGKKFVSVKHSDGLEEQSKYLANYLVNRDPCVMTHCKYLPFFVRGRPEVNCNYGENLFVRYGGIRPTANEVVRAWVEGEADIFNSNFATYQNAGHFSMAIWRPTEYIGCHVASNVAANCHIGVCTYAKPGNCGYKKGRRIFELYKDDSDCKPACPPEGCK